LAELPGLLLPLGEALHDLVLLDAGRAHPEVLRRTVDDGLVPLNVGVEPSRLAALHEPVLSVLSQLLDPSPETGLFATDIATGRQGDHS
jgi:hypothetical protein